MTILNKEGIPVGHILMRLVDYNKESIYWFIIIDQMRDKVMGKKWLL